MWLAPRTVQRAKTSQQTAGGETAHGGALGTPPRSSRGRRVILSERSEIDGERRRQPAVTARADSHGAWKRVFSSWPSLTIPRGVLCAAVTGLIRRTLTATTRQGVASHRDWSAAMGGASHIRLEAVVSRAFTAATNRAVANGFAAAGRHPVAVAWFLMTQRKPMWLIPVSIICGRRAAGR